MTSSGNCPLCANPGGDVLWRNSRLRVVKVDDASHPGFTRVIWQDHVGEMSELRAAERDEIMSVVWQVEQAQRQVLRPGKINLAQLGNMVPHLHWHVIPRWADDSHFPQAIWAPAPPRPPAAEQAWQAHKARILALLPDFHTELAAALSRR
ncbi:HIT family protein [Pollutimonas bauzanensis]|uniref:Diadenosine tetraphosphate (Ap4A) hydrolase n=1 Tax=Pollutimonas bauzanensis TaxID=658167 RepID=A0A1M5T898_9BURK|nr:HIT family protein [Pollutimonas bauzanensis]SHH46573.1 Diadenosine tetraphosphate (Ap4A) hydrolase [Pollutimonas bauzanensis]